MSMLLFIPDIQFALRLCKKGQGNLAFKNTFSAQIQNMSIGLGLPMLIKGLQTGEGVIIPASKIVSISSIFLMVGALILIGMTLVPLICNKNTKCQLDDLRGKILLGVTILLAILFIIISLKSNVFYKH